MIISDLSHFEEVVSEASIIVGGETKTTKTTKLPTEVLEALSDNFAKILEGASGTVVTVEAKTKDAVSSTTTGTFNQGTKKVKVSSSSAKVTKK